MKSLMLLLQCLLSEEGRWCRISTERDSETITSRVKDEGESFLTITLPNFARELEKALDEKMVTPRSFPLWKKNGKLPMFLGGFLELIFDTESGYLLSNADERAVRAVRQISLFFSKIELECSEKRIQAAFRQYVEIESELKNRDSQVPDMLYALRLKQFETVASKLWSKPLWWLEKAIKEGDLIPKHGPGGTADRLKGNQKFLVNQWPQRLDDCFQYLDYAIPNHHFWKEVDHVEFLTPGAEIPVRVIAVPKTMKTPRIIAAEPTAMQYMQQAISDNLVSNLEGRHFSYRWMIGFQRQEPNQQMAKEGSLYGDLATLDLSEASDRVSNQHVRLLTKGFPRVSEGIQACRSRKADVPGHGVIRLAKFASMGSALTFPLEAMVFLTIIFMAIEQEQGRPLTKDDIASFKGRVRVYGDDIVIPGKYVQPVIRELGAFGYLVNSNKSFWSGNFRESCGKEYFRGFDVSVEKCRYRLPSSLADVQEVEGLVSLRNRLFMAGNWETAKFIDEMILKLFTHKGKQYYPIVEPTSPVLGRWSFLAYSAERISDSTHSPLVKGYVRKNRIPRNCVGDYAALQKVFLKRSKEPFADKEHLERSGRPEAADIKLRWASPF
jgi:hypothetical protein